jgi:hypothetical protein
MYLASARREYAVPPSGDGEPTDVGGAAID